MMKIRLYPAMVLLLLNAPIVFAQTKPYSLPEIWQRVRKNYPSLAAGKEAVELQKLQKKLLREGYLPDLHIQAQQSYGTVQSIPGSFFPLPGMFTLGRPGSSTPNKTADANLNTSALIQWNFMQFGRQQKQLASANAEIHVSNTLLRQEEWRLLSIASRIYFSVLATSAELDVARSDTKRFSNLLELLQSQANAGLRPGADTLLVKASMLQSRAKEHDFLAKLKISLLQLSSLMGDTTHVIPVDTTLFYRFKLINPGSRDKLENHPCLQVMNARIRSAIAEKEIIKTETYPAIGLLAGFGLRGSPNNENSTIGKELAESWQNVSGNYLAGIALTWNFASLYQNKTKRAVADRRIAAARANWEAAQLEVQTRYASALARLDEQRQKLMQVEASLNASKEVYGLYEVRYRSGLLNLIELLQLQKNLQEAESNYVLAVSDYWNELLNEAETLGDPSFILTVIKS